MTTALDSTGSFLDPKDWADFRAQAHRLLDSCVDRIEHAREAPWKPVDGRALDAIALGSAEAGEGYGKLCDELIHGVMPFATGNTHPRFFGWVHGTGLAAGLLTEMAAAAMNSNCGGRDHGAVYVEREVIEWCRQAFGFPEQASGVLVTGTSQATVLALACARQWALGDRSRAEGIQGAPRLLAYAAQGVHNAATKALELLGLGGNALQLIACDAQGSIDIRLLQEKIDADRRAGHRPFCVIGTAGSVDLGAFDRLDELARVCASEQLWLHVDGAFGAWLRITEAPWNERVAGIERADSIAFDFHKWMFVPYDCGAVLIRDSARQRAAFAARPAYLAAQTSGLGGGEPWFCDLGTDLSRGFRALKVWGALKVHGRSAFASAITRCCELARRMAERVERSPSLSLAAPVRSCICCFSAAPRTLAGPQQDAFNQSIAQRLQLAGEAVFSTTTVGGRTVLRAAITNHRTTESDIDIAIDAVERACAGP
jgi:aromatic-L-amino-acid/L-tryptophan decarboxylase